MFYNSSRTALLDYNNKSYNEAIQRVRHASDRDCNKLSPVNINVSQAMPTLLPALNWAHYQVTPSSMTVRNSGFTVLITATYDNETPYVNSGPLLGDYVFSQIHFHWGEHDHTGSGHAVNGLRYPLEMHVVHLKKDCANLGEAVLKKDGIAVMVHLFSLREGRNTSLDQLTAILQFIRNPKSCARLYPTPLAEIVHPFTNDYFLYWGAVSSPRGEYRILWLISQNTLPVSAQQLKEFRQLYDSQGRSLSSNSSKPQPLAGRSLFLVSSNQERAQETMYGVPKNTESVTLLETHDPNDNGNAEYKSLVDINDYDEDEKWFGNRKHDNRMYPYHRRLQQTANINVVYPYKINKGDTSIEESCVNLDSDDSGLTVKTEMTYRDDSKGNKVSTNLNVSTGWQRKYKAKPKPSKALYSVVSVRGSEIHLKRNPLIVKPSEPSTEQGCMFLNSGTSTHPTFSAPSLTATGGFLTVKQEFTELNHLESMKNMSSEMGVVYRDSEMLSNTDEYNSCKEDISKVVEHTKYLSSEITTTKTQLFNNDPQVSNVQNTKGYFKNIPMNKELLMKNSPIFVNMSTQTQAGNQATFAQEQTNSEVNSYAKISQNSHQDEFYVESKKRGQNRKSVSFEENNGMSTSSQHVEINFDIKQNTETLKKNIKNNGTKETVKPHPDPQYRVRLVVHTSVSDHRKTGIKGKPAQQYYLTKLSPKENTNSSTPKYFKPNVESSFENKRNLDKHYFLTNLIKDDEEEQRYPERDNSSLVNKSPSLKSDYKAFDSSASSAKYPEDLYQTLEEQLLVSKYNYTKREQHKSLEQPNLNKNEQNHLPKQTVKSSEDEKTSSSLGFVGEITTIERSEIQSEETTHKLYKKVQFPEIQVKKNNDKNRLIPLQTINKDINDSRNTLTESDKNHLNNRLVENINEYHNKNNLHEDVHVVQKTITGKLGESKSTDVVVQSKRITIVNPKKTDISESIDYSLIKNRQPGPQYYVEQPLTRSRTRTIIRKNNTLSQQMKGQSQGRHTVEYDDVIQANLTKHSNPNKHELLQNGPQKERNQINSIVETFEESHNEQLSTVKNTQQHIQKSSQKIQDDNFQDKINPVTVGTMNEKLVNSKDLTKAIELEKHQLLERVGVDMKLVFPNRLQEKKETLSKKVPEKPSELISESNRLLCKRTQLDQPKRSSSIDLKVSVKKQPNLLHSNFDKVGVNEESFEEDLSVHTTTNVKEKITTVQKIGATTYKLPTDSQKSDSIGKSDTNHVIVLKKVEMPDPRLIIRFPREPHRELEAYSTDAQQLFETITETSENISSVIKTNKRYTKTTKTNRMSVLNSPPETEQKDKLNIHEPVISSPNNQTQHSKPVGETSHVGTGCSFAKQSLASDTAETENKIKIIVGSYQLQKSMTEKPLSIVSSVDQDRNAININQSNKPPLPDNRNNKLQHEDSEPTKETLMKRSSTEERLRGINDLSNQNSVSRKQSFQVVRYQYDSEGYKEHQDMSPLSQHLLQNTMPMTKTDGDIVIYIRQQKSQTKHVTPKITVDVEDTQPMTPSEFNAQQVQVNQIKTRKTSRDNSLKKATRPRKSKSAADFHPSFIRGSSEEETSIKISSGCIEEHFQGATHFNLTLKSTTQVEVDGGKSTNVRSQTQATINPLNRHPVTSKVTAQKKIEAKRPFLKSPRERNDMSDNDSSTSFEEPSVGSISAVNNSPIKIDTRSTIMKKCNKLNFINHWDAGGDALLENNGKTLRGTYIQDSSLPYIQGGPLEDDYVFSEVHFHWGHKDCCGTEHVIDGQRYTIEAHFLYFKKEYGLLKEALKYEGGLAIVAVNLTVGGPPNPLFGEMVRDIPLLREPDTGAYISAQSLFSWIRTTVVSSHGYYSYQGSLTLDPPNTEAVIWMIFADPIVICCQQSREFRTLKSHKGELLIKNYRSVQPLNNRPVYYVPF